MHDFGYFVPTKRQVTIPLNPSHSNKTTKKSKIKNQKIKKKEKLSHEFLWQTYQPNPD